MGLGQALDEAYRELVPTGEELKKVRDALNKVEQVMQGSPQFSIAKRYPCGSFAKETMLKGRKEAELIAVLVNAPTPTTLVELRKLMATIPGVGDAREIYRCVTVYFPEGVRVDVLPVAESGVTAEGPNIPDKLRHAIDSPKHVDWFKKQSAKLPALQQVVRLMKKFKQRHQLEKPISFALEVLSEEALRAAQVSGLEAPLRLALSRLANGRLNSPVIDPVKPGNDLLGNMSVEDKRRAMDDARKGLASMDSGRLPF